MNLKNEHLIDSILDKYLKNGCDKKTLIEIRRELIGISKSISLDTVLNQQIEQLTEASIKFLESQNLKGMNFITGLSTGIYIHGNKDYKILIYGGKNNNGDAITPTTLFDMASMTKFYTLVLKDKLVEMGILKNNELISNILDFGDFKDFTLEDLSLLCGELRTDKRIDTAKNKEEAFQLLKTIHVYSSDKTVNKYSDFGSIITALVIEKKYNEYFQTNLSYDQILDLIILKPYGLLNTIYNPSKDMIVAGNGNNKNLVHDPKTRLLGGVTGSAGLFTTNLDQMQFAKAMFSSNLTNPISPENIKKYGSITFPSSPQSNKGHFGLYQKNKEHSKFLCPRDYSDGSFTAQGFTGSSMIFDPINKIQNTIFVNAINDNITEQYKHLPNFKDYIINEKANGFMDADHTYQDTVTKTSLILKIANEIFQEQELDIKIKIKNHF